MTEIEKAIRHALRQRGKVQRIESAIAAAAWEANMQGRLHPAKDGQSTEQREAVTRAFEAAAVRMLRGDPLGG